MSKLTHDESLRMVESYKPYRDRFGFITPDGKVCANGVRYTTEYAIALHLHADEDVKRNEYNAIHGIYSRCFREPGLLMRTPENEFGQDSIDNYTALGTFAFLSKRPDQVMDVLNYWEKHRGVLNNENPSEFDINAYMVRFRALKPHLKLAVGLPLTWWDKINWSVAIALGLHTMQITESGKVLDQDGKSLALHCMVVAYNNPKAGWLINLVARLWVRKFRETVSGGWGRVLYDYFDTWHALCSTTNGLGDYYGDGQK